MMGQRQQEQVQRGCAVGTVVLLAWMCRVLPLEGLPSGLQEACGILRSLLYLSLFAGWGISLYNRTVHPQVRRLLLYAAIGLTEDDLNLEIPYVLALAMDGAGRRVLREMRVLETLPIINAGQTPEDKDYFELELRAAGLYGLSGEGAVCAPSSRLRDERIYVRRSAE